MKRNPGETGILNRKFNLFFKDIIGDVKIEELKIPYCAVGSNLNTGSVEYIKNGKLIDAMRASTAIPLIRRPVVLTDEYIFDGGLVNPVPTSIVREMGAEIVVGVSLYGGLFPLNHKKRMTLLRAGVLSRFITLKKLSEIDMKTADIKIDLQVPDEDYGIFSQFYKGKKLVDFGYEYAKKIIDDLDFGDISLNKSRK